MSHGRRRGPPAMFMEKAKRTRPTRLLLGKLWGYLGQYRNWLLLSGLLILTSTIAQILSPYIIKEGLDGKILYKNGLDRRS